MTNKSQRVEFILASAVSLAVHAILVFLLYEAYSELRELRRGAVRLISRDSSMRIVELPELAVRVDEVRATAPRSALRRRPDDVAAAMPRATLPSSELLTLQPRAGRGAGETVTSSVRRRQPATASLPLTAIEAPLPPPTTYVPSNGLPALAPASAALPHNRMVVGETWLPSKARSPRLAMLPTSLPPLGRVCLPAQEASTDSVLRSSRTGHAAFAFAHRFWKAKPEDDREKAIVDGLAFLARVQHDDGRWRFDDLRGTVNPDAETANMRADAAATGLAILAFLGAGHDHFDGPYAIVIEDALRYLLRVQQSNGELFPEDGAPMGQVARFYSHGIATLALCEAYGMTGDANLRQPAQRALDYLAATQSADRGGWRYVSGLNSDLSVTGWQTAALRSGELAGLQVQLETLSRVHECLEMCRSTDEGNVALFRYNPWASPSDPLTRHGREPSTVMTAAGLAMHFHLGGDASDARAQLAGEHIATRAPEIGDAPAVTGTLDNPLRDTYYWYYATQAMYYVGGDAWQGWSERLDPLLIESQEPSGRVAGSWDPLHPTPDKWAAYGGRLYVTAMNLLSLEIRNRHLRFDADAAPQIAELPDDERR